MGNALLVSGPYMSRADGHPEGFFPGVFVLIPVPTLVVHLVMMANLVSEVLL